ncbi:MAG: U32 family peptidase, partial [Treponemataceae bacterium]|nr:U32 family peptidase [Treponemataceae bacterium]
YIAGPYLYTFNRWAVSWLENRGVSAFVSPYENSRKNLEAVFEESVRARVLIPVFAYPALFRLRFRLPERYDFTYFSDKSEMNFKVNSTDDGSFVMPEIPFSIADKTSTLEGAGFKRFLLDFSKTRLKKAEFRQVMQSYLKKIPLEGASLFNWKEGFYSISPEEYKAKFGEKTKNARGKRPSRRK